ncbi:MAG: hypothetical protein K8H88_06945, partial [Sandaracinaceae bacterium]|nr:hypothetical protein [Sandaracinaceae bacterium]
ARGRSTGEAVLASSHGIDHPHPLVRGRDPIDGRWELSDHLVLGLHLARGATRASLSQELDAIEREHSAGAASSAIEVWDREAREALDESGWSIGMDDLHLVEPSLRSSVLAAAESEVRELREGCDAGLHTEVELTYKTEDLWGRAGADLEYFAAASGSPIVAMAKAGIDVDLAALDGLRSIDDRWGQRRLPVEGVADGLCPQSFFVLSAHSRRQELMRLENEALFAPLVSGLHAQVRDLAIVRLDCESDDGRSIDLHAGPVLVEGRVLARSVLHPLGGHELRPRGALLRGGDAEVFIANGISSVSVRWLGGCLAEGGVCVCCYGVGPSGRLLALGERVGEPVPLALARLVQRPSSWGRPHICGLRSLSPFRLPEDTIVRYSGARFVETNDGQLACVRPGVAELSAREGRVVARLRVGLGDRVTVVDGGVLPARGGLFGWCGSLVADLPPDVKARAQVPGGQRAERIVLVLEDGSTRVVALPCTSMEVVEDGAVVSRGDVLAHVDGGRATKWSWPEPFARRLDAREPPLDRRAVLVKVSGTIEEVGARVGIRTEDGEIVWHRRGSRGAVRKERVERGDPLGGGERSHRDLLRLFGRRFIAQHMIDEIDLPMATLVERRHLELVVWAMLRHVRVVASPWSDLRRGSIVPRDDPRLLRDGVAVAAAITSIAGPETPAGWRPPKYE